MSIDLEIARKFPPKPIAEIASKLKITPEQFIPYGHHMAKLPLDFIDESRLRQSKLVLVSATTPTPAGEGKTTISIGLTDGLNKIGRKAVAALREPSLGPVFGMKGGATGGGHAQVQPMEDINLHFTGDFAAVEKAHNLLSAMIDNAIQAKMPHVHIDPRTVRWKRVMDMNDRALRQIVVGLGGKSNGFLRETGFDITAASEIMAILCFADSISDLKKRLGNIYIGNDFEGNALFARDIKAEGAMAALLKHAIRPNLVQTLEGNPVLLHGGPFANIAQGTNTVIATKMAMSLSEMVVTEAGFAFDLGGEKFLDLKCRYADISPAVVVLVTTVRALKYHGGQPVKELQSENAKALHAGFANLKRHAENVKKFNLTPIIAINRFPTDTEFELAELLALCKNAAYTAAVAEVWAKGGEGARQLAELVAEAADKQPAAQQHRMLYPNDASMIDKISTVAHEIYRAKGVKFAPKAQSDLKTIEKLGLGHLPVCIAKTQYSFSDNPKAIGTTEDFEITIREIEVAAGAGFVIPIAGELMRMPGLPNHPAAENIDINDMGQISGLF
ncbi:MAG: formate--tetrahydrofolate ligase [Bacteroidia bacterium]